MMKTNDKKDILKTLLSEIDERECKRMHYRMGLAVKIAEALKRKGMNQKDLANELGKKPAEISKWLTGNHNFTIDTLVDIQSALDIKLIDVENSRFETIQTLPEEIAFRPQHTNICTVGTEQISAYPVLIDSNEKILWN